MKTPSSFVTYIDESGDEGFTFHPDGSGSSPWFVLSATVTRQTNDLQIVSCLKEVRDLLGKPPKKELHFKDLKHEHRVPYLRKVSELPIRTVTVAIYKPAIAEPEKFQSQKFLLYRYATKLLLERVSWLCRDHYKPEEGDGFTDIIFSNRSNMSYEEIRSYLQKLLQKSDPDSLLHQLYPQAIDPCRIRSVEHSKMAGLQVADAVASGIHWAVKVNRYGETEDKYLSLLRKTLYRHRNETVGYGIKLWPDDLEELKEKAPEVKNFEGL